MDTFLYSLPWTLQLFFGFFLFLSSIQLIKFRDNLIGNLKVIVFVPAVFSTSIIFFAPFVHKYLLPHFHDNTLATVNQVIVGVVALGVAFLSGLSYKMAKDATDYSTSTINCKISEFDIKILKADLAINCLQLRSSTLSKYIKYFSLAESNDQAYIKFTQYALLLDLYVDIEPTPILIHNIRSISLQRELLCLLGSLDLLYLRQLRDVHSSNANLVSAVDSLLSAASFNT